MRVSISVLLLTLLFTSCSDKVTLILENRLACDRHNEMVGLQAAALYSKLGSDIVLSDSKGRETAYQLTSDSLIIFQADVNARSNAKYFFRKGKPTPVKAKVYGRKFPEHKDNMNWENDRGAFVAYGPALQDAGERGFGYDIWTKSVDTLVIEERNRLRDKGISLHKDHGNGMDAYIVANTLGAGTAALLDDDHKIIFPWAWQDYEILDNGPLRFKVRLTYRPRVICSDSVVVEQRVITLDAGSDLNLTEVSYLGLNHSRPIVAGIVIHLQNPYGEMSWPEQGIIAYADSTDNATKGNGVIYVGAIMPHQDCKVVYLPIDEPARDALGHILTVSRYEPGDKFTYYWGSTWSKRSDAPSSPRQWLSRLKEYALKADNPINIKIK